MSCTVARVPQLAANLTLGAPAPKFGRIAERNILRVAGFASRARGNLNQPGRAMSPSTRRNGKAKAIAEMLAMIADAHPEFAPRRPRPARAADDWSWEDAADFTAALEKYFSIHPNRRTGMLAAPRRSGIRAA